MKSLGIDLNKKWTRAVILSFSAVLGLLLRVYNLNFPSIGYHNMKENEYLSIAQEMINSRDLTSRKVYFYNAFSDKQDMRLFPQIPLVSYQILASWKILGENLWGPRLLNVIFGIASIVVIYFIGNIVFSNYALSLLCSFLLAIMPLGVFFSRNLQPESPAFFFVLLGTLFYLKFALSLKNKDLFLGGLFFSFAWIYKMNFIFSILPVLFCIPFGRIMDEKTKIIKRATYFLLSFSAVYLVLFWLSFLGQWQFDNRATLGRVKLFELFTYAYWQQNAGTIFSYMTDENYGFLFTCLAFLGLIVALVKRKGLLNRYLIGAIASVIVYSMFFSDFINQHNYYQMPFLGVVCLAIVWLLVNIDLLLRKFFKKNFLVYLTAIIIGFSILPVSRALFSLYGTNFWGVDVAGESIKSFTKPGERFFLLAQTEGQSIARFAQRYGGWVKSPQDFLENEAKFKIKYFCIYPAGFLNYLKNYPTFLRYIRRYYRPREIGLIKGNNRIVYIILEKWDKFDYVTPELKLAKIYKLLGSKVSFYTLRYNFSK